MTRSVFSKCSSTWIATTSSNTLSTNGQGKREKSHTTSTPARSLLSAFTNPGRMSRPHPMLSFLGPANGSPRLRPRREGLLEPAAQGRRRREVKEGAGAGRVLPGADVDDLTARVRCLRGAFEGFRNVRGVHEVPGL